MDFTEDSVSDEIQDPFHCSSDDDPDYSPVIYKNRQTKLSEYFDKPSCSRDSNFRKCSNEIHLSTPLESKTVTENARNSDSLNSEINLSILDGKYFKIHSREANHIQAVCQMCLPLQKIIKGSIDATTNFVRHLKRTHGNLYEEYNRYKQTNKKEKNKEVLKQKKRPVLTLRNGERFLWMSTRNKQNFRKKNLIIG